MLERVLGYELQQAPENIEKMLEHYRKRVVIKKNNGEDVPLLKIASYAELEEKVLNIYQSIYLPGLQFKP